MFLNVLNFLGLCLFGIACISLFLWGVFQKLTRVWVQKDIEERYSTKLKVPRYASTAFVNYLPGFVVLYWLLENRKDSRFYKKRLNKLQSPDNLLKKIDYDINRESKRNIIVCFGSVITSYVSFIVVFIPLIIVIIFHYVNKIFI